MVFQDGQAFIDERGDIRCQNVLDNLIFRREIPPMIAVFINPGRTPEQTEPSPAVGWGDGFTNRRVEYNTPGGGYSRVVCDELLPAIEAEYNISSDPQMRGIGGSSSGAIAAFMVAWERPEAFHKVLSNVGSFTDIEGGHVYPDLVRAEPVTKPIRVFLCDGRNDNRSLSADGSYNEKRDWFYQNVRMQSALEDKGYDLNYTWGVNLHGQKFGGHAMPEMMRWLWRDCTPVVTDPRDLASRSFLMPLAKEGPTWGTTGYASYPELIADLDTRGYTPIVLGTAIDGSHIVAVKAGGTKLPPIFLSAGAHSTEQAGVCAAVDLLDELQCDHELWVLPCRDPIGLTGYRHALHLGLPFELEPAVDKWRASQSCCDSVAPSLLTSRTLRISYSWLCSVNLAMHCTLMGAAPRCSRLTLRAATQKPRRRSSAGDSGGHRIATTCRGRAHSSAPTHSSVVRMKRTRYST